jgi:restriction system protein
MNIPDYQSLMLPLLRIISDGQIHHTQAAVDALAQEFKLTEDQLNDWLPSKKQKTFPNRVHWAKAHLKMAGAIENTGKGNFRITDRGRSVLAKQPITVNVKLLRTLFSDYDDKLNSFSGKKNDGAASPSAIEEAVVETPEELIESGYQKIRTALEAEIIAKLKTVHPTFFEKIVIELLVKMGYGGSLEDAGKAIGKSGDEGIDGIIKEDKLGLDVIYVQAKRWEGSVGRPELQKFIGALAGQGAKKGIFITTSTFTKDAELYMPKNETKMVLLDGVKLAQYMIDYNLGVSMKNVYEIKRIDSDFFDEDPV